MFPENGSVSFEEFVKGLGTDFKLKSEDQMVDELREAFAVFDKNDDGFLSVKELKAALFVLGERVDDNEAQAMLDLADIDKDGRLNYKGK